MSYPLTDIEGIDEAAAKTLKRVGVRTSDGLLEAAKDAKGRKTLAEKTGFNEKLLLKWANVADRMRIKGIGAEYAELVRVAGVNTVRELKYRNAARLTQAMKAANEKRKLVRFLPSEKAVTKWIERAKKLPLKISY
jgi:predicted flap endonuclease-1-like 5' DNA nuclease